MINVVHDVDVRSEQLLAHPVHEKRALIENCQPSPIPEHETYEIEDCGGLENYGVFSGTKFTRMRRRTRLLCGDFSQRSGMQVADVRRVCLLPSRGITGEHGDGNFCRRLAMKRKHAARVGDRLESF